MGGLKKLTLIVVALSITCSLITVCTERDTQIADVRPRAVEPRLSAASEWRPCRKELRQGHLVEEAQCGEAQPPPADVCEDIITTHAEALRILSLQPACTDGALAALERFARTDPGARSDVAAAYLVRAQREDRPSDFLRALEAAEQAVKDAPGLPAARFNRALALDALGFPTAAMAAWTAVERESGSEWTGDARTHRARLARDHGQDAQEQWRIARGRLPEALRARDGAEIARLIAPFPLSAERYLEEELLPRWADAPSPEKLAAARLFASEVSRRNGDRFTLDLVDAVPATPEKAEALRKGLIAFREARLVEQALVPGKAAPLYDTAAEELTRAGNPLRLLAEIGRAVAVSFQRGPDAATRAMAMLDPLERVARTADYVSVRARIAATRAYFLEFQGRAVEALAELDTAQHEYTRLHDEESLAAVRGNRSTILVSIGQPELGWNEAWQGLRSLSRVVELNVRHRLLGETAEAALALGYPRVALLYQNAALRLIHNGIASTAPENLLLIGKLQKNLSIVLRHRAAIELRVGQFDRAEHDLEEASRLANDEDDADVRRLMKARVEEVLGKALLQKDPNRANEAFTRAMELASVGRYFTFRASLAAQRSDARRRAGRKDEAEADLRAAISELRSEELLVLEHRTPGKGERFWSSYFSRPQESYRLLIRQLIEEGRPQEAFAYAEKARAFEPLDLVRRLETLPPRFRRFASPDETVDLAEMRAALPPGTFVVEYCVLEDRTYTWILSRDAFALVPQRVKRRDVDRWTEALQRSARKRDASGFEAGLFAPYDALISRPLAAIRKLPGGTSPRRLIFIPDGAMHGLPFSALRDPVTRRYLVQEAPIEIAASTRLYLFSLLQDQALSRVSVPSILLFGDPKFDETLPFVHGLKRLPYAQNEVESIRGLYAPNAAVHVDSDATSQAFLREARQNTIVHVAAHGIVNAQAPTRSLLLFAPFGANRGALYAEDLLTELKLDRTRLVVLSTCSSAGGLPVGPEGVAPLVRPLIAAGVPAVIGSLWDVQDATAEELLVSFHRHYRQGSDAAVAMQTAQIDLLRNKNPGLRSAFAWAPFQVIGHASSPYGPSPHH
jgi:CHAT domain-containing protein